MSDDQQPVDQQPTAAPKAKAKTPSKAKAKAQPTLPPLQGAVMKAVNAQYEKGKSALRVGTVDEIDYLSEVTHWVPTGLHGLDLIMSLGKGLPVGRFIEVFGNEGSGKTALCEFLGSIYHHVLHSVPHYLDYECSYDQAHWDGYGVPQGAVLYPDLHTMEEGWDYIGQTLEVLKQRGVQAADMGAQADPPALFLWDSLAQATPKAEMEEDNHQDSHVGLVARAAAKGFRKFTRPLSTSMATVIFVNQVRDNIGAMGHGPKTTTPGGRAAKFAYSMRLRLAKIETLKKGDDAIGQIVEVQSVKNKHAPYPAKAKLMLSYRRGIDINWSNFLHFKEAGYIIPAGGAGFRWKALGKDGPAFKRSAFTSVFTAEHPEIVEAARLEILAKERAKLDEAEQQAPRQDDDEDADASDD